MKTLKELRKSLSKNKGTYASLKLNYQSKNELFEHVKFIGIPNVVDRDQYHTTVIYSRKEIPQAYALNNLDGPFTAIAKEWRIFPSQDTGHCLVLVLDCIEATEMHNEFMSMGATYDYPEYIPHITIATNYTDAIMPQVVPYFSLKFDKLIVEPLDLDYTYKKA
jgi:2'-5' RNA ligase